MMSLDEALLVCKRMARAARAAKQDVKSREKSLFYTEVGSQFPQLSKPETDVLYDLAFSIRQKFISVAGRENEQNLAYGLNEIFGDVYRTQWELPVSGMRKIDGFISTPTRDYYFSPTTSYRTDRKDNTWNNERAKLEQLSKRNCRPYELVCVTREPSKAEVPRDVRLICLSDEKAIFRLVEDIMTDLKGVGVTPVDSQPLHKASDGRLL